MINELVFSFVPMLKKSYATKVHRSWPLFCSVLQSIFLSTFLIQGTEAKSIELSLPINCEPGINCFVQNYVDLNFGPGANDFTCGGKTYDNHKGTDFRLLSAREIFENVNVVAAASGKIRAIRDGMPDRFFGNKDPAELRGKDCGNGVVINHGNGWETQYCHLKKGSVAVETNQIVHRGQVLGAVGLSGLTNFAHLHFSLRYEGKIVDPFTNEMPQKGCDFQRSNSLWASNVSRQLGQPKSELLEIGFLSEPVNSRMLERGQIDHIKFSRESKALIFYARYMNINRGDRIRLTVTGPSNIRLNKIGDEISKNKAQYVMFVGKKLRTQRWLKGKYIGQAVLIRRQKPIVSRKLEFDLKY